ncbi:regulator of volume decrease after cellular swelling-domain-containing protein [Cryomyces antarcticus]|uniref:Regulator of volume decrease after cellular swelling-domain-containing protein n=1 Tax=Cryomyces antarcticus TaxID=329879 RepID=A0ABR0LZI2_9PEZI|nr:hypothetical protein LTR39_003082 [Cryomyces antarcticus]KAK5015895.1 hypothetical protein LTR60_002662 [Cryomyces antarcticus]KAK5256378.1 hypothetical protein LTR16_003391 [Cryomyces antarcticus]
MSLESIHEVPSVEGFTPISDHRSQTPSSFFGGRPVLHLHSPGATLLGSKEQLEAQPTFARLCSLAVSNGNAEEADESDEIVIPGIDIWVTSEHLLLFATATSAGVSIPYPTISLHAIQRRHVSQSSSSESQGLYMQLTLTTSEYTPEEDIETLEITLIPSAPSPAPASTVPTNPISDTTLADPPALPQSPVQVLFGAVTACADLHPDPQSPSSSHLEPRNEPIPGAGGWITSENMDHFLDENGEFCPPQAEGGGDLGPGAGLVRLREDTDEGLVNGGGTEEDETKWRRTD